MDHVVSNSSDYQSRAERNFFKAIDCYLLVKAAPAISAHEYDSTVDKSVRWTPDGAHFTVDVEHGVEAALGSDPELLRAFQQILSRRATESGCPGEPSKAPTVTRELTDLVIRRVSRIIDQRGLLPTLYFRKAYPKRRAA